MKGALISIFTFFVIVAATSFIVWKNTRYEPIPPTPPQEQPLQNLATSSSSSSETVEEAIEEEIEASSSIPPAEKDISEEQALEILLDQAKINDTEAQYTLGLLFASEEDNLESLQTAYAWFVIAKRGGHPLAAEAAADLKTAFTTTDLAQTEEKIAEFSQQITDPTEAAAARNAQRRLDIEAVRNAMEGYKIRHGDYPASVPRNFAQQICEHGVANCDGKTDLSILVTENVLTAIPRDPLSKANEGTNYALLLTDGGQVTVFALKTELEPVPLSIRNF